MKKALTLLLAALLVLGFAGCKNFVTLTTNATVFGVVYDESGNPLEGATVTLIQGEAMGSYKESKDTNVDYPVFEATTDANGRYSLGAYEHEESKEEHMITQGEYIIEVSYEGFSTYALVGNIADLATTTDAEDYANTLGLFGGTAPAYTDFYNYSLNLVKSYDVSGILYAVDNNDTAAAVASNGSLAEGAVITASYNYLYDVTDPSTPVYITSKKIKATVDEEGKFTLAGLPSGSVTLAINYEADGIIYDKTSISLSITKDGDATLGSGLVVDGRDSGIAFPLEDADGETITNTFVLASSTEIATFSSISSSLDAYYVTGTNSGYRNVPAAVESAAPEFTITFNKDIASVSGSADLGMAIETSGNDAVYSSISISEDKRTVTVKPEYPLFNNTNYNIKFEAISTGNESVNYSESITTAGGSGTLTAATDMAGNADYRSNNAYMEFSKVSGAEKYYVFAGIKGEDLRYMGSATDFATGDNALSVEQFTLACGGIEGVTGNVFSGSNTYDGTITIGVIAASDDAVSSMFMADVKDNYVIPVLAENVYKNNGSGELNMSEGSAFNATSTDLDRRLATINFHEPVIIDAADIDYNFTDTDIAKTEWVWEDAEHTKGHVLITGKVDETVTIASSDNVKFEKITDAAGNAIDFDTDTDDAFVLKTRYWDATNSVWSPTAPSDDDIFDNTSVVGYSTTTF